MADILFSENDGVVAFQREQGEVQFGMLHGLAVVFQKLSDSRSQEAASDSAGEKEPPSPPPGPDLSIYLRAAEKSLAARFGRKVNIISGKKKGKIELEYYNPEDLNTLLDLLEQLPSSNQGGADL